LCKQAATTEKLHNQNECHLRDEEVKRKKRVAREIERVK
jgi:hypothetical protein